MGPRTSCSFLALGLGVSELAVNQTCGSCQEHHWKTDCYTVAFSPDLLVWKCKKSLGESLLPSLGQKVKGRREHPGGQPGNAEWHVVVRGPDVEGPASGLVPSHGASSSRLGCKMSLVKNLWPATCPRSAVSFLAFTKWRTMSGN